MTSRTIPANGSINDAGFVAYAGYEVTSVKPVAKTASTLLALIGIAGFLYIVWQWASDVFGSQLFGLVVASMCLAIGGAILPRPQAGPRRRS